MIGGRASITRPWDAPRIDATEVLNRMKYLLSSDQRTGSRALVPCLVLIVVAGCMRSGRAELIGTPPTQVTTFRVFELAMTAQVPGSNPYVNGPPLSATFTGTSGEAEGRVLTMRGFWDGGNVWRVRFAATAPGEWSYLTSSPDPGLDGHAGSVTAVPPTPAQLASNQLYRGFLKRDGYAWKLSDGKPFFPVGDTQWSFSEEFTTPEWEQWMDARQAQKFNTFLGTVWLAIYSRAGVPEAFPNKNPQTDNLNVTYFQRLDHLVQYANDRGIMMGLTIGGFPDNSNWWNKFGTLARNDRWFRYCVARYAAYNVRWCLYGEVDERNPPGGWGGGITTWQAQVAHDAQLVRDEDPYDHPIGSHHRTVDTSSADNPNIDYIEVQIGQRDDTQYQLLLGYRVWGKPVWSEEYWYEPAMYDDDYIVGIRNTHRNFVAAMAFPTMGSLMRAHYPQFDVNDVTTDPGAVRMAYFHDFFERLNMRDFEPAGHLVNRGQCGRFGLNYAIFLQGGGTVTLDLTGVSGTFNVRRLDINSGATADLPSITGGAPRAINAGTANDVSVLVRLAPGVYTGPDRNLVGTNVANLNGAVIVDDGVPADPGSVTTLWTQIDGPGIVNFEDATTIETTATFPGPGTFVLRLTAEADASPLGSDDKTVVIGVPGDMDGDTDVDMDDFGLFQVCLSGTGIVQANPDCAPARLAGTASVDLEDLILFSGCMSGAHVPGDPTCLHDE